MTTVETREPFVGRRLRRKEDARLVRGAGWFVPDRKLPGMLHAAILRSPFAHARIERLDVSGALACEGVVAAFTGSDLAGRVGRFQESARKEVTPQLLEAIDGTVKPTPFPVLADEVALWVGAPVAVVVASDRYAAEDALEAIEASYEPLEPVAGPEAALRDGAPVLHPELGDNVAARFRVGSGDVEAAFASAPRTLRRRFAFGRHSANSMETRSVQASYDEGRGELTVWLTNARPHLIRTHVSEMLGLPLESVRVVVPDMGGSFGTGVYSEDALIPFLAMELRRPVRWVEDRQENLAITRHARDQVHDLELAYDDDGRILALRDRFLVDVGAYNAYAITVSYNAAAHLRGQYAIDCFSIEGLNVLTTKAPVSPVRGAGRPEAVFALDRALDLVAADCGLDPADVRRRNMIPAEEIPRPMGMPYRDGAEMVYDSGDFPAQLEQALEAFDYDGWREQQTLWRAQGRRVGIGISSYVEGSGFGPHEGAVVRLDPAGNVRVVTGAKPHGQGLETTLAQICADELGVDVERVTVASGDTGLIQYGIGTFASRSAVTAGSAVGIAARRLREKVLAVAGVLLDADPDELDLAGDEVVVRGEARAVSLAEVAHAAAPGPRNRLPAGMEPGLEAQYYFQPPTVTFASGTHLAAVEVDEETGFVEVLRYLTVDDCGRMLNPMVVEGQIQGGVAHGIGTALYEESLYDEDCQLLSGTYMDYLLPSAVEVPPIEVGHQQCLSELNPFGIKGCGEGGAVSPPAAIANAVADAFRPERVELNRVPIRPEAVLEAVRAARARDQEEGGAR
ncbi:MAG TPA: xanthine dehydrogenase family protein molybdopterin-binding subunit [Gaiellaceae bacterium]|nr:xanthine dehydrogenase family protein molybdopterin-binding subunit [Gaiellaceae bacterium]